jgi:pilus assembly protein CpaB
MRAKSMVLLLIAGVCGLVASIGISQVIERGKGGGEVAMGELFVAVAPVDIGAKLDATNVKLDKWPKDRIPEGAIRKLEDLKDRFPRVRLYAGEPILDAKLMDSKDSTDRSQTIPEGYRVVSVKVTMDEVVSGLVQPGDRVDVLAFIRANKGEVPNTVVQTILRDVRVFAINAETERSTEPNGEQMIAKTCSLLVKPNHVERVTLAGELGKLRLSLRRPNDTVENTNDEGTDIQSLLTGVDRRADDRPIVRTEPTPTSNILDLLNKQAPAVVTPVATVDPTVSEGKSFKMTILGPAGSTQFQWRDPKELPTQVTALDSAAPVYAPVPTPAPSVPTVEPPSGEPVIDPQAHLKPHTDPVIGE